MIGTDLARWKEMDVSEMWSRLQSWVEVAWGHQRSLDYRRKWKSSFAGLGRKGGTEHVGSSGADFMPTLLSPFPQISLAGLTQTLGARTCMNEPPLNKNRDCYSSSHLVRYFYCYASARSDSGAHMSTFPWGLKRVQEASPPESLFSTRAHCTFSSQL